MTTSDFLLPRRRPGRLRRWPSAWLAAGAALLLAGCAGPDARPAGTTTPGAVSEPSDTASTRTASVPRRVGEATYYADFFEGRPTASGELYDSQAMTAAHRTLPFGTRVKVTTLDTGESAVVTINDRGPFVKGRIIDLSARAAEQIGLIEQGKADVQLQVLSP
ncbi:septal ring lytic transglycosylase RlpA family protein [Salinicola avicenniae]|nr:septal ring lytic transglycosylase RlpA family protein [Salinicola sp. S1-1-8]